MGDSAANESPFFHPLPELALLNKNVQAQAQSTICGATPPRIACIEVALKPVLGFADARGGLACPLRLAHRGQCTREQRPARVVQFPSFTERLKLVQPLLER